MADEARRHELLRKAIADGKIPRALYKYRGTSDLTIKIFNDSSMWFSRPSSFNDPFDCNLSEVEKHTEADADCYFELIEAKQRGHMRFCRRDVTAAEITNAAIAAKKKELEAVGVLCLSQAFDSVLMWSHYAENHKGLVVELDPLEDLEFFCTPVRVKYMTDYVPTNFLADAHRTVERVISTKSSAWSYEGEVRILKARRHGAVPLKPTAVKRVTFGCRAEQTFVDRVRQACDSDSFRHVKFDRMEIEYGRFALRRVEL